MAACGKRRVPFAAVLFIVEQWATDGGKVGPDLVSFGGPGRN
jgi:hypothetical protein